MEHIKKYIKMIVDNGKQEDMECLSDMLSDTIHLLKEDNYEKYKKYKSKLMGMAYDYKINKEMAYELVENMKPLGEYWNIETVASVIGNNNHRIEDMYLVMNSLANDYGDIIDKDQPSVYVKLANAWLDDIDSHKNKIWKYFVEN